MGRVISANSAASAYAARGRFGETGGGEIVVVRDVPIGRRLNPQ